MQDISFREWMRAVDKQIAEVCGLSTDDLPDQDYRGLYNTGNTPAEAVRYVFERCAEDGMPDLSDMIDLDS